MTIQRFLLMAVAVLMLCSTVSAISIFKDGLPSNLTAGANVTIAENIRERPQTQAHLTSLSAERIHPANATPASLITIMLKVSNRGNERVKARLSEDLRPGVQYPDPIALHYHTYEALKIPYYSWDLTLEPGSTQTITYHVKPEAVGMIAFTAALLTDEYGNQVESAMTSIRVSCIPNGVCDAGENTIFCPEDCPRGGSDGICDGSPDGRIDPDCIQGYDPDAAPVPTPVPAKKGLLPGPSVAVTVVVLAMVFLVARRGRNR
jgi:hypothetical protein